MPSLLPDILPQQPWLLGHTLEQALKTGTGSSALRQKAEAALRGDLAQALHDGSFHAALCAESLAMLAAGEKEQALAWGRAAHVITRRFAHCWLPFLDIIIGSGLLGMQTHRVSETAIPHQLMQFWDKPDLPEDVRDLVTLWQREEPGFQHSLVNEEEATAYITAHYPQAILTVWQGIEHVAGRSDFFRLCWLAREGGTYIDADEHRVGPLASLLTPGAGLVVNWSPGPPPCVNNWFIAARPGHPALAALLQQAVTVLTVAANQHQRLSPWIATGPGLFSMAIMDAVAMSEGVPELFSDLSLQPESFYRTVALSEGELSYRQNADTNWKLAY
ncbi:glycosyltransferase family 32 protein [Acetobacter sp.]|uniref:glycosyltransferase family 32 protein n=1 Tax=Acetobacter sp. TaxID=440 RepID=UPI0039ECA74A